MIRRELLLLSLAEECVEVAQRVSKALRFGEDEVYPNHPDGKMLSNIERVKSEFNDLYAVALMLGIQPTTAIDFEEMKLKQEKVEKYLKYSAECGIYEGEDNGMEN